MSALTRSLMSFSRRNTGWDWRLLNGSGAIGLYGFGPAKESVYRGSVLFLETQINCSSCFHTKSMFIQCLHHLHLADHTGIHLHDQGQHKNILATQTQNKHCFYATSLKKKKKNGWNLVQSKLYLKCYKKSDHFSTYLNFQFALELDWLWTAVEVVQVRCFVGVGVHLLHLVVQVND